MQTPGAPICNEMTESLSNRAFLLGPFSGAHQRLRRFGTDDLGNPCFDSDQCFYCLPLVPGDATMKMIVAIVQAYDTDRLLRSVTSAGFRVTRIQSTGGFLRSGNSTVLMGVEDGRVQECLRLISSSSCSRIENVPDELEAQAFELTGADVASVAVGGAVVFVLPVTRFERIPSSPQAGCKSLA